MYNDNPTLTGIKNIDESRQGQVFFKEQQEASTGKHFYIESYGCQMNFSDSEIVASILGEAGFAPTRNIEASDLILINTCSIREKAEDTVRKRLRIFNKLKDKNPKLVISAEEGEKGVNVFLSREETYADISPVRLGSNGVTAFISIMRGCDNMCSFCVVPFTRGRERSRDAYSIIAEAKDLFDNGYKEVTLLGQNVDSYKWSNPDESEKVNFAQLLERVALINPQLRVRFSTSHPKDITDEVLYSIAKYENICNYIHLPVQSGNSRVLKLMNRTYDREWYKERVESIYRIIPDCAISSDIITGFCTETEDEHKETLSIMEWANYSMSYMFFYSERPGTLAERKYEDDIPLDVKKKRLSEVIRLQNHVSLEHNKKDIGSSFKVLIEGDSKKSADEWKGRNSQNKMIVFPKLPDTKPGDYVTVEILDATSATLIGHQI